MRVRYFMAAIFLTAISSVAARAAGADGHWRVEVTTTVGNCQKSAAGVLTLANNRVVGIDSGDIEPWGYVDEEGVFVGHFTMGAKVLRANGAVKGNFASGPWSSPTEYCGGRWSAQRVD